MKLSTIVMAALVLAATLVNPVQSQASTHHHHYRTSTIEIPIVNIFSIFEQSFTSNHRAKPHGFRPDIHHYRPHVAMGSGSHQVRYGSLGGECGIASWYSLPRNRMANGQRMNPGAMTIAHKYLPLGTVVRLTNQDNGISVIVTAVDRGPYIRGRIADLTPAVARKINMHGLANVCITRV